VSNTTGRYRKAVEKPTSIRPKDLHFPPIGHQAYDEISAIIDGVDHVAVEMEAKWGVGRLELLVDDDLRGKFRRQGAQFDDAIREHDLDRVRRHGAAMRRAWAALDAAATAAGASVLSPEVWEVGMADGRVVGVARTNADAFAVTRSGRYLEVWTLEEIARVIDGFPDMVVQAKQMFPGTLVTSVKARRPREPDWNVGDDVPF
jgi:hypothetical protein